MSARVHCLNSSEALPAPATEEEEVAKDRAQGQSGHRRTHMEAIVSGIFIFRGPSELLRPESARRNLLKPPEVERKSYEPSHPCLYLRLTGHQQYLAVPEPYPKGTVRKYFTCASPDVAVVVRARRT